MNKYLNGWFPAIVRNGELDIVYHYHVSSKVVRDLGEWMWVGRA